MIYKLLHPKKIAYQVIKKLKKKKRSLVKTSLHDVKICLTFKTEVNKLVLHILSNVYVDIYRNNIEFQAIKLLENFRSFISLPKRERERERDRERENCSPDHA